MFDKLKELNKLRKTQAEIKGQLESIFSTYDKKGVRVVVRGDRRIEKIEVDGVENRELREAINEAYKDLDKKVEKQMRGKLSDLGINL